MKIVSSKEMKRIDMHAIRKLHMPALRLMENAGRSLVIVLHEIFGASLLKKEVLVLTGKGNNAGDGFVVARLLHQKGIKVTVCLLAAPKGLSKDAESNFKKALKANISCFKYERRSFLRALSTSSLIVDALFGTGLSSRVRGSYREVIRSLNKADKDVISIDIPSGVSGDTGEIMGEAIQANHTMTIGLPKTGLVVPPAIDVVGELHVRNIGFPLSILDGARSDVFFVEKKDFVSQFPKRKSTAHKGSAGHVLVIAGSPGKAGAAAMAVQSAFRTGSGLVTLLTHEKSMRLVSAQVKEAFLDTFTENQKDLSRFMKKSHAIAIGPGLGFSPKAEKQLGWVLKNSRNPIVVDADGLTILSKQLSWLRQARAPVVLTPHPGEMARLTGKKAKDIEKNRFKIARDFARKYRCYVVLKGARTVIASPKGEIFVNSTGNVALATAGSGDVLTGMIVSLLGQGMAIKPAIQAAVYTHGLLADCWVQKKRASRGMMSRDLIKLIPSTLSGLMRKRQKI